MRIRPHRNGFGLRARVGALELLDLATPYPELYNCMGRGAAGPDLITAVIESAPLGLEEPLIMHFEIVSPFRVVFTGQILGYFLWWFMAPMDEFAANEETETFLAAGTRSSCNGMAHGLMSSAVDGLRRLPMQFRLCVKQMDILWAEPKLRVPEHGQEQDALRGTSMRRRSTIHHGDRGGAPVCMHQMVIQMHELTYDWEAPTDPPPGAPPDGLPDEQAFVV